MTLTDKFVEDLRDWLGDEGLAHYGGMRRDEGSLIVGHFQSGMQVRNFMRSHPDCQGCSAHDYDELWEEAVYRALDGSTSSWKRVLEPEV